MYHDDGDASQRLAFSKLDRTPFKKRGLQNVANLIPHSLFAGLGAGWMENGGMLSKMI